MCIGRLCSGGGGGILVYLCFGEFGVFNWVGFLDFCVGVCGCLCVDVR